jgi:hypothetical protein
MPIIRASAPLLTRPGNGTQYAVGDLVANDTAAASVTNRIFTFERFRGPLRIRKWLLQKTDNDVTAAAFLLHLFTTAPTYATNGDNDPVSGNATTSGYIGTMSIAAMYGFVTHSRGQGVPVVGDYVTWEPDWGTAGTLALYGIMVANGTYTPTSSGTFANTLEGEID